MEFKLIFIVLEDSTREEEEILPEDLLGES
jgi:hypothetical protein